MSVVAPSNTHRRVWLEVEVFENYEATKVGRIVETEEGTWRWTHTFGSPGRFGETSGIKPTQSEAYEALLAYHDRFVIEND